MSTQTKLRKPVGLEPAAAVETTMHIIGGKWKGVILYHLIEGELRFNQIRKKIPGITQRMLTLQLRDLERYGIIDRIVYQDVPPRVGYRLNEQGKTLIPLVRMLRDWGTNYVGAADERGEATER